MNPKKTGLRPPVAATLPGEYGFIAAIVSDLRDDSPKLVYADWLEERGDRRGPFVRELVAASRLLKKGMKLPDSGSFPRAWTNMLGLPLLEGIIDFDLIDVKDLVLGLARPIVAITTKPARESHLGVGGSKFGGRPDLPATVNWPACERGPLGFLGQIALRELQGAQVARALPGDGLLSFFAYQNYETGYQPGVAEGVADDTRVLYTAGSVPLTRREPPGDLGEGNAILPACRLAFCETWDLPDREDVLPLPYAADLKKLRKGGRDERLHDLRGRCHPFGHHLLGYSVHFRCLGDPSPGADWSHLLCLDSDDNLGWSWCDGEHLAVFVHEEDLRSGSFTRVYGYAS